MPENSAPWLVRVSAGGYRNCKRLFLGEEKSSTRSENVSYLLCPPASPMLYCLRTGQHRLSFAVTCRGKLAAELPGNTAGAKRNRRHAMERGTKSPSRKPLVATVERHTEQMIKSAIPTYQLEQINERNPSWKELFFTDTKLQALESILNKPYRSNYYGLGLCVSGHATLMSNLESWTVEKHSIIAMSPQVIKQWKNVSEDFDTFTIFFTKSFFTRFFLHQNYLDQFSFFEQNTKHVHHFSATETEVIRQLFENIKIHSTQLHPYQNNILASYINILLFEYQALFEQRHFVNSYQQSRNQQVVEHFRELLNKHLYQQRGVKFYADQLFITAKYLTEILKQETGKTASDWINELLILEAKILLSNPQLQITQIAETLHFPDTSTFGKFFKKLSGVSPIQYRKAL